MLTHCPRPSWTQVRPLAALLAALSLTLMAFSTVAVASPTQPSEDPTATVSSAILRTAFAARSVADHKLAIRAKALRKCLRKHPKRCEAARRAARRASRRLIGANRLVSLLAHRRSRGKQSSPVGGAAGSGAPTGAHSGSSGQTSGASGSSHGSGSSTQSTGSTTASGTTGSGTTGSSTPSIPGSTTPFEMGVVAGSSLMYELPFVTRLGAHTARMEFAIGTPASQIAPIAEAYARAGIRPLLLATFDGTIPSSTQAKNIGTWAAAVGPGGSAWKGKAFPAGTAVTSIEFGNETSYSYQYSNDSASGYATRAQEYAIRFKEAQESIQAVEPSVGLLAQGDPGNAGVSWMDNMFKAVPNLGQLVAGWTVHPYGPNWQPIMDEVISSAQADGAPSTIPLDVTEWGLSTDNGRCLTSNYGFNACMTYQEAASALQSNVTAMHARYGARLATVYLYEAHDLKATGTSSEREAYFGALQSNEAAKGAYTSTVESLLAANS